jgi:hypothetical protein
MDDVIQIMDAISPSALQRFDELYRHYDEELCLQYKDEAALPPKTTTKNNVKKFAMKKMQSVDFKRYGEAQRFVVVVVVVVVDVVVVVVVVVVVIVVVVVCVVGVVVFYIFCFFLPKTFLSVLSYSLGAVAMTPMMLCLRRRTSPSPRLCPK